MSLVLILFFGLMFVGLPIGVTLGVAGVIGLVQIGGENFLMMAPRRYFQGLDLFTFMAMPFFILAGEIMNRSDHRPTTPSPMRSSVISGVGSPLQHDRVSDHGGHDGRGRSRDRRLRRTPWSRPW
jgi:hypothetical protein